MKKILIICFVMTSLLATSCMNKKKEREVTTYTETPAGYSIHDVIKGSLTNSQGKTLHYTFDNDADEATFMYQGETIKMHADTMASGVQYSNDHYTYTEWHGQVELKKDGQTIFEYTGGQPIEKTFTDANGKKLDVSFDNENRTANLIYEGEKIQLKQEPMASGFKYGNGVYEYTEHQGSGELKKNGKSIFQYKF